MSELPPNTRKLLRRHFQALLIGVLPRKEINRESLTRALRTAALTAVVHVLRNPERITSAGLPQAAALLAPWLGPLSRDYVREGPIPEDLLQALLDDQTVQVEADGFLARQGLPGKRTRGFMQSQPQELAARLRERDRASAASAEAYREQILDLLHRMRQEIDEILREDESDQREEDD
jgi:hypothetical protein